MMMLLSIGEDNIISKLERRHVLPTEPERTGYFINKLVFSHSPHGMASNDLNESQPRRPVPAATREPLHGVFRAPQVVAVLPSRSLDTGDVMRPSA